MHLATLAESLNELIDCKRFLLNCLIINMHNLLNEIDVNIIIQFGGCLFLGFICHVSALIFKLNILMV